MGNNAASKPLLELKLQTLGRTSDPALDTYPDSEVNDVAFSDNPFNIKPLLPRPTAFTLPTKLLTSPEIEIYQPVQALL